MYALMLLKRSISSQSWKLTKEIKNFRKSPILKNLIFKNLCIDQLKNTTSIKQVIITQSINNRNQFHSILPNLTKSPNLSRTLISKIIINHEKFEIKVWESCLNDAWWKTHDSVLIKNPINIKNPKFWNVRKSLKNAWKCMITCNLMEKKSQKSLTLNVWKKTFESLTKKTTKKKKKKKIVWRYQERNQRERQRNSFKSLSNSYLF